MDLVSRCRKILKDEYGADDKKIDWFISHLNPDAIRAGDLITDDRIRNSVHIFLWYGLEEAISNYLSLENNHKRMVL
jgi:hypothetical protein